MGLLTHGIYLGHVQELIGITGWDVFGKMIVGEEALVLFEGVAKSRKTLSIDRPGKGIERGRCTRCGRRPAGKCAVLRWLSSQRQEGFWLQCRASSARFYTYFHLKIGIFSQNRHFSLENVM